MKEARNARTEPEALLAQYPPLVRELAAAARRALQAALPGAAESVDAAAKLLGYSYGPGLKGLVCTLLLSKTGVKLGIARGSELPDPAGLVRGEGKLHRHVPLREAADVARPELQRLLHAAVAACRARIEAPRQRRDGARAGKNVTLPHGNDAASSSTIGTVKRTRRAAR